MNPARRPVAAETVVEALPPIYAWEQEEAADWPRPPELVQGVLYRGSVQGRKTFLLSDLAVSVAAGVPWLSFPQQPAFVVRWEYPCWQRAPEADPEALQGAKSGKGAAGRRSAFSDEQLAALLAVPGLDQHEKTKTDLAKLAAKVFGMDPRTVWRRLGEIES